MFSLHSRGFPPGAPVSPTIQRHAVQEDVTGGPAGQNTSASIRHNEELSCKMRMRVLVLALLLPVLMSAESECRCSCRLTNISITVESEECGSCVTIDTTACAGLCWTMDRVYPSSMAQHTQKVCNFKNLMYKSYEFKGCPAGVDSVFVYPVALSCECNQVNSDTTDWGAISPQTTSCSIH
ncbi:follitropin subunit beta isoform X2 [Danio rerio]|uniref:Follitropin subunit beta isoform X2 n=1 Tax=Danio rerio TaxID=7955 RepID=A0AC58FY58_DANRE